MIAVITLVAAAAGGISPETQLILNKMDATAKVLEQIEGSAWTEEHRMLAEKYAKLSGTAHEYCISRAKYKYVTSGDAPDFVATAIITACGEDEIRLRRFFVLQFRGIAEPTKRESLADTLLSDRRKAFKDVLIGWLVEQRLPPARARK